MVLAPNETVAIGHTREQAVTAACRIFADSLAVSDRRMSVVLSGGNTPPHLFASLTSPTWRGCVDWDRIDWFWGDERAVPPDHADSNYRMARETLFDPLGIDEAHIHRMPADASDLDRAAVGYEQLIRELVPAGADGVPVFDLALLGVGEDGHTASLFPATPGLTESRRLVVAHAVASLGACRMTMTYPLLRAARQVLFLVMGRPKAGIMRRILSQPHDGGLPAAALRPGEVHAVAGRLTWVMDKELAEVVFGSAGQ